MPFHVFLQWITTNRYALLLGGMLVENPASTVAAGFTASLGVTNLYGILILAAAANLVPDYFFYAVGYWGKEAALLRYGRYIGITRKSLERTEKIMKKHARKALVFVKLVPVLGSAGTAVAGSGRMKFGVFFLWATVTGVALSTSLVFVGYWLGVAYRDVGEFLHVLDLILVGLVVTAIIVLYLRHDFGEWLMRILERD